MTRINVLSATLGVLLSAAVLALKPGCETSRQLPSSSSKPSYLQRGNRVQEHYDRYTQRLNSYYQTLLAALTSRAPELLSLLEPASRLQHGYQILPEIVADAAPVTLHSRARSAHYSWPWTDHLIRTAVSEIGRSNYQLNRTLELKPGAWQRVFEQLAREYRQMVDQQQNIHAHIQYNRLWQDAIAANRLNYDRETALHAQVRQRQEVREVFSARETAAVRKADGTMNQVVVANLNGLSAGLRERENLLAREIDAATNLFNTPGYVRIEQQNAHLWIVHVPFYTDIEDSEFVQSAKREIENRWHLRSGEDEFRIEVEFSYISPSDLYRSQKPPQHGMPIDTREHVGFFPTDRAILTTGAITTHVDRGAIILGPHNITPAILAHEFGHILGFRDAYIRAYRDLGKDGFEVMEIVAQPNDIMGAPATGPVLRRHYQTILKNS
jgi:hypothetical protein